MKLNNSIYNSILNNYECIELFKTTIKNATTKEAIKANKKLLHDEKKLLQSNINTACTVAMEDAKHELNGNTKARQLRSCNATVYDTKNYYLLKSYNTFVACIDKNSDILYDALRIVYGYTASSARQIAKFNNDYCEGVWTCKEHLIAR